MDTAITLQADMAAEQLRAAAATDFAGAKTYSRAKMREKAEDFESFFLGQMLQPMFANIEAEEPFNGGPSAKIWKSMMVDEMAKEMTEAGGIGLADMVMRELIHMQEGN
jgi:flagellar protein FlgJ